MKKCLPLAILIKGLLIICLIIMIFSVFFMFIYCIMPLNIGVLRIFNGITVFLAFTGGNLYSFRNLYFAPQRYSSIFPALLLLSPLIIFSLLLLALTLAWGDIIFSIWLEKTIIAALGSLIGFKLAKKLYKSY